MTVLKSLLLKQPDVLVLPDLFSPEVAKLIFDEVTEEGRYAVTRIVAPSAIEALLKLMATYPDLTKSIIKITCGVINLRLFRRLCTECRQPFQPSPQLLQKLGLPAGRVQTLYQPFIPPPPEQRVDANGKPLEIEICPRCNGRGYYGRVAIFELLQINDQIRQALQQKPDPVCFGGRSQNRISDPARGGSAGGGPRNFKLARVAARHGSCQEGLVGLQESS